MRISELPQATEVTGEEILPVVQNGETKKVSRDKLVGTIPNGLTVENGKIFLVSNGEKMDEGAPLPQITVDSELSAESKNPVQNRAIAKAIENSKPMLITFNNSDFDNSDSQQLPIGISFKLNQSRIMLIATFDVSRLNFRISDGSDYSIYKVLIEGEPFDLSMLDEYIKSMETLESDYGEGWIVEGSQYAYMHEYSFGNVDNANTVFAELSEMGLNGFQLFVNNYNKITAKEV